MEEIVVTLTQWSLSPHPTPPPWEKNPRHALNMKMSGNQMRVGHFGEEKAPFSLPRIEPPFLDRRVSLCWLLYCSLYLLGREIIASDILNFLLLAVLNFVLCESVWERVQIFSTRPYWYINTQSMLEGKVHFPHEDNRTVYIRRPTRCTNSYNVSLFIIKCSTCFGLFSPSSGATFGAVYRNWYKPVRLARNSQTYRHIPITIYSSKTSLLMTD